MAIAFHAAADLGNNGGASGSLTASFTCGTGSDRLLVVSIQGDIIGSHDDITSVTYGGTAMTLAKKDTTLGNSTDNRYSYIYYLIAPATGSNNVVISCSNTHYILAQAADYTGVNQSGQPDAVSENSSTATSVTASVTTVADNSWTILVGPNYGNGTAPGAGTGSTLRASEGAFNISAIFDSNAAITPAGSHSMTLNNTSNIAGHTMVGVIASFSPVGAGGGGGSSKFRKTFSSIGRAGQRPVWS